MKINSILTSIHIFKRMSTNLFYLFRDCFLTLY
nr:MAG TPA: hypothetical protein [Microviridae sp.]